MIHEDKGLQEKMLHSYINSLGPALREGRADGLGQPPRSKDDQELHEPCEFEVGSVLVLFQHNKMFTKLQENTASRYSSLELMLVH